MTYTVIYPEDDEDDDGMITIERTELTEEELVRFIEQTPDDEYKLKRVHPNDLECLELVRGHFKTTKDPISFQELKGVMYDCVNTRGRNLGQFAIIHCLRRLWRAGYIRRFVKKRNLRGVSSQSYRGRGNWEGVHYIVND